MSKLLYSLEISKNVIFMSYVYIYEISYNQFIIWNQKNWKLNTFF